MGDTNISGQSMDASKIAAAVLRRPEMQSTVGNAAARIELCA
jgi:hypothetical protein